MIYVYLDFLLQITIQVRFQRKNNEKNHSYIFYNHHECMFKYMHSLDSNVLGYKLRVHNLWKGYYCIQKTLEWEDFKMIILFIIFETRVDLLNMTF